MHPSDEDHAVRRRGQARVPTPIMLDEAIIRDEWKTWSWSPTCISNTKAIMTNVRSRRR